MGEKPKSDATVRVECPCGHEAVAEARDDLVECACGRTYAITVTELEGPGDAERDGANG